MNSWNQHKGEWLCIDDPEQLFTGRVVKDFARTLFDACWPPGSVWVNVGDGKPMRVWECGRQWLEEA